MSTPGLGWASWFVELCAASVTIWVAWIGYMFLGSPYTSATVGDSGIGFRNRSHPRKNRTYSWSDPRLYVRLMDGRKLSRSGHSRVWPLIQIRGCVTKRPWLADPPKLVLSPEACDVLVEVARRNGARVQIATYTGGNGGTVDGIIIEGGPGSFGPATPT
ncbi:MAG: hypothetical protein L3K07_08760 [Thermoplasmata archaeon]|nr:hypothetical protein [Thermoplasmata archaeon]